MFRKLAAAAAVTLAGFAVAASVAVPAVASSASGVHKHQSFTFNGVVPTGGLTYSSYLVATATS